MTQPSALTDVISAVVIGKPEAVELAVTCLLAEGHLLIEDVPGTGKTTLARALAAVLSARASRIQFTPDLLPADITGTTILDPRTSLFEFHPGPVFANVVLADEINRASPKTQSALLEVMEERTVTVDGQAHPVGEPFMVTATQNPIDMEGTYALPEAQLDRFLMRISIGHLDPRHELAVIQGHDDGRTVDRLRPVMDLDGARHLIATVRQVHVSDVLAQYVVDLVGATRRHPHVRHGASTRATLALVRAARARALVRGRSHATADDIQALAEPVLAHRLVLAPQAELDGVRQADVVREVLDRTSTPEGGGRRGVAADGGGRRAAVAESGGRRLGAPGGRGRRAAPAGEEPRRAPVPADDGRWPPAPAGDGNRWPPAPSPDGAGRRPAAADSGSRWPPGSADDARRPPSSADDARWPPAPDGTSGRAAPAEGDHRWP